MLTSSGERLATGFPHKTVVYTYLSVQRIDCHQTTIRASSGLFTLTEAFRFSALERPHGDQFVHSQEHNRGTCSLHRRCRLEGGELECTSQVTSRVSLVVISSVLLSFYAFFKRHIHGNRKYQSVAPSSGASISALLDRIYVILLSIRLVRLLLRTGQRLE